jgi:ribosomal protein S12 methylthiotransferase accessory factor YcaO
MFSEVPTSDNLTFDADLDEILGRLRAVGLREVAVFDLTRQDVGVPVVKILVPGLENDIHHAHNYEPGARAIHARSS